MREFHTAKEGDRLEMRDRGYVDEVEEVNE